MKVKSILKVSLLGTLFLVGCAGPKVSYVDPNAVNNLTTNFTQNDLRATAQYMATQLIQSGKMNSCKTFTISPVKNSTDQYVDTSVMSSSMADTLTNSSAINAQYITSLNDLQNNVDQLAAQNQSGLYDQSTSAKMGKMQSAQCIIDGNLTSDTSVAPDGKSTLVSYTFFVKLKNVQTGVILFSKNKPISKGMTY